MLSDARSDLGRLVVATGQVRHCGASAQRSYLRRNIRQPERGRSTFSTARIDQIRLESYYLPPFSLADFARLLVWRPGRVVEGTSLLRKHMGLNLYRGFESLGLRQLYEKRPLIQWAFFFEKETSDVPADIACGIRRAWLASQAAACGM